MTEHEFKFFQNEWTLYVRATQVTGQTLVDELYSTMSADLRKLAYDQGDINTLATEALMMERIQSLAVSVLHTAVHTVTLHEAEQAPEETVKTFAARVRGIAANCELQKTCGCGATVNYTEETVYHVVLAGLRDRDLQARCTSQALLKQITDITTLVNFCTAEESSKLGAASTVAGLRKSAYKQQKAAATRSPSTAATCRGCGGKHSGYSPAIREKECRAYKVECHNCGVKGHFSKICSKERKVGGATGAKVEQVATVTEPQTSTMENSAIEFSFFAIEVSNQFQTLQDVDEDMVSGKVARESAPGCDQGWRSSRPPRRGSRKVKPTVAPPSPPDMEIAEISGQRRAGKSFTIPICSMEYNPDRGWIEQVSGWPGRLQGSLPSLVRRTRQLRARTGSGG